jgi:hypothetical protein
MYGGGGGEEGVKVSLWYDYKAVLVKRLWFRLFLQKKPQNTLMSDTSIVLFMVWEAVRGNEKGGDNSGLIQVLRSAHEAKTGFIG